MSASRKPVASVIGIESARKASATQHDRPQPPDGPMRIVGVRRSVTVLDSTARDAAFRWLEHEVTIKTLANEMGTSERMAQDIVRVGCLARIRRRAA